MQAVAKVAKRATSAKFESLMVLSFLGVDGGDVASQRCEEEENSERHCCGRQCDVGRKYQCFNEIVIAHRYVSIRGEGDTMKVEGATRALT